ncbi:MAG TPA: hypothetical protein VHP35_13045 [Terriglobia bacterium]|nr:hypothetical protein [Terriglobia bacterium]
MTNEHEKIARLEAEFKAKEQELERLSSVSEGTSVPVKLPAESVPSPDPETQVRRAEAEAGEALKRYEEALNSSEGAPGT